MKITRIITRLLFINIYFASSLHAQYGVLDSNGKMIIPFEYGKNWYYNDGYFAVTKNKKRGIIDFDGNVIIPFEYEQTIPFSEDLAAVKKDGKFGYVNKSGQVVIPFQFDNAQSFKNGRAVVMNFKGRDITKALINKKGELIIPFDYTYVTPTEDGLYNVSVNNSFGLFDRDGKEIAPVIYSAIFNLEEGIRKVQKKGKTGYLDKNGQEIIPCVYGRGTNFKNGIAVVYKNRKYHLIDTQGNIILTSDYEFINEPQDGMLAFGMDGKQGYIGLDGKVKIPATYKRVGYFHKGLATVTNDKNLKGIIDKKGNTIVPFEYESIGGFSNGYAYVSKNNKSGFIDRNGKLVVPMIYDQCRTFDNGFSIIRNGYAYGIMDSTLKVIAPPIYDTYTYVHPNSNQIWLKKDGKKGCLDFQGNLIVPFIFDEARPSKQGYTICKTDDPAAAETALNSAKGNAPTLTTPTRIRLDIVNNKMEGENLLITFRIVNEGKQDAIILQPQNTISELGYNPKFPNANPEFFQPVLDPEVACEYAPLFIDNGSNTKTTISFKSISDFKTIAPGKEVTFNIQFENFKNGICKEHLSDVKLKLIYRLNKRYLGKDFFGNRAREAQLSEADAKAFYQLLQQCYKAEIVSNEVNIKLK